MQSQQDENLTLIEDFAQIFPLEERILRAQREGHSLLVASYCEVNGASSKVHPFSRTIFLIFFRTEVVHKPIGQKQF